VIEHNYKATSIGIPTHEKEGGGRNLALSMLYNLTQSHVTPPPPTLAFAKNKFFAY